MATRKQVENYRKQSKIVWNSVFIGIPSLVIGYVVIDLAANMITGNFLRRVGEVGAGMIILSIIVGLIMRKWIVVQKFTRATTPYEEKLAEYYTWFAARQSQSLADEAAWNNGEISYTELRNRDAEFKADADKYWSALEEFKYAKLSNNIIVYHNGNEDE